MIKLKSRYPGLTQLIIANTATAIKVAEKNRPEGGVFRNLTSLLNNFILLFTNCVDTPVLQGEIGVRLMALAL